jgi:hypothetical protein
MLLCFLARALRYRSLGAKKKYYENKEAGQEYRRVGESRRDPVCV